MKCQIIQTWLKNDRHVKIDLLSLYTKEQNRAAEHSENIIKDKAHTMRKIARLPAAL